MFSHVLLFPPDSCLTQRDRLWILLPAAKIWQHPLTGIHTHHQTANLLWIFCKQFFQSTDPALELVLYKQDKLRRPLLIFFSCSLMRRRCQPAKKMRMRSTHSDQSCAQGFFFGLVSQSKSRRCHSPNELTCISEKMSLRR